MTSDVHYQRVISTFSRTAWAILPDTAPAPLGSFQVGASGSGYLEAPGLPTTPGMVLALTREPGPGATAPSSDPVSVGTATATG